MNVNSLARSSLFVAGFLAATPAYAENPYLHDEFARFVEWFPATYDNHEQVRKQQGENSKVVHERRHQVYTPIAIDALGEHVYLELKTRSDDPATTELHLYSVQADVDRNAIVMSPYRFKDEALFQAAQQQPERLRKLGLEHFVDRPGCEIYWQWQGKHFDGALVRDACSEVSSTSGGRIIINDELRLTADELSIRAIAVDEEGKSVSTITDPYLLRKARYYEGWAAMKRGGKQADADSEDWIGMRGLRLHNEGARINLVNEQGGSLGYTVELARLPHQGTQTPILKLALIDDATGKTISDAWTEPEGKRIGINLGWLQADFALSTKK